MPIAIKTPGPKVEEAAVEKAETELGRRFPEDYRRFLLESNGGTPETNEFDVPQTKTDSGVNGFYGILGAGRDEDLVHEQGLLTARLPSGVIAIADAEGGNRVCLSLRTEDFGAVFFWDHELEFDQDVGAALTKLAGSFDAFLVLLRRFDPQSVQLKPGQVKKAWINPEFLNNLKK